MAVPAELVPLEGDRGFFPQPLIKLNSISEAYPPQAGAGGILVIGYSNVVTGDEHRLRVHIAPFGTTHGDVENHYDWPYVTDESGALEHSVGETAQNILDNVRTLYNSDWNFWIESLSRIVDRVPSPVYPCPLHDVIQGTLSDAPVTNDDTARFIASVITLKSENGGRYRISLMCAGVRALRRPSRIFARWDSDSGLVVVTGGFSDPDQAFIAYLLGGLGNSSIHKGTQIVAHDGSQLLGQGNEITTAYSRLRRRMGFVRGPRISA